VGERVREASDDQASSLLETFFDVESIVNVIAMNTVLGATDDWRQRRNFYWYTSLTPVLNSTGQHRAAAQITMRLSHSSTQHVSIRYVYEYEVPGIDDQPIKYKKLVNPTPLPPPLRISPSHLR
jgi:hypothetical protein